MKRQKANSLAHIKWSELGNKTYKMKSSIPWHSLATELLQLTVRQLNKINKVKDYKKACTWSPTQHSYSPIPRSEASVSLVILNSSCPSMAFSRNVSQYSSSSSEISQLHTSSVLHVTSFFLLFSCDWQKTSNRCTMSLDHRRPKLTLRVWNVQL